MIPQNVTSRYARHLLVKGKNNTFHLLNVGRQNHYVDGAWIANYYVTEIVSSSGISKTAAGATPEQAVTRCLDKHGVTFR